MWENTPIHFEAQNEQVVGIAASQQLQQAEQKLGREKGQTDNPDMQGLAEN